MCSWVYSTLHSYLHFPCSKSISYILPVFDFSLFSTSRPVSILVLASGKFCRLCSCNHSLVLLQRLLQMLTFIFASIFSTVLLSALALLWPCKPVPYVCYCWDSCLLSVSIICTVPLVRACSAKSGLLAM